MGNHRWSSLQVTMTKKKATTMKIVVVLFVVVQQIQGSNAQQTYVNNKQLDCEKNYSNTQGFVCNGPASSCISYLTFRSNPPFNSPVSIAYLLGAEPSDIVRINDVSSAVDTIPTDTLVVVPVNCSCFSSAAAGGVSTENITSSYYQHNASYVLRTKSETYFSVANNTFEGLTTCQSLIAQNPYNYRELSPRMKIAVPLRCACPSSNQTRAGVKYLLTYLITWDDSFASIADTFGVDNKTVWQANELSSDSTIFPFTPVLVPLKTEPTKINTAVSQPPPPPSSPALPAVPVGNGGTSSRKWAFVGAGVGGAVLLLIALSGMLFWFRRRRYQHGEPVPVSPPAKGTEPAEYAAVPPESNSWSVSSEGVRYAIGSLTVYKFYELQKATGFFGESNRIKGSVYRGSFKGDDAAVKVLKGDVSCEINILKQINHSNIIRLSGYCVHDGNTYLVYEFAQNGSLSDWLHSNSKTGLSSSTLRWKQRVQVAHDIADALNYLHNYTNPPYIHKNLKSSNILLDSYLRAKVANFGLARSVQENQDVQLTRHVVGTHGYMAPEYIENGLVTPKLDVFAFGVVMLELLSGREAASRGHGCGSERRKIGEEDGGGGEELLSATIVEVVGGEDVREKLRRFVDPRLGHEYPLDLAYSLAQLAKNCVVPDLNSRPAMSEVFMTLSKILSSSMDWDPSEELGHSRSLSYRR